MRLAVTILVLLLSAACVQASESARSTDVRGDVAADTPLIRLIARPADFDGQRVRVIGFVRLEFEGNVMYPHKEDYDHALLGNGVWLSISDQIQQRTAELTGKYCLVEGRFSASNRGHMGVWSGAIEDVSRFQVWSGSRRTKKSRRQ